MNEAVYVVDDSEEVRTGLCRLLESAGYDAVSFACAENFLSSLPVARPGCVILDVKMPGLSGSELHEQLVQQGLDFPVIFLTGHGDVPSSVRAMKLGAADFLQKPVVADDLLMAISSALARYRSVRAERQTRDELMRRYETLSRREKQVMQGVVDGRPNKLIADEFGLHEQTIKQHRGAVMRKMGADSLAELVRMASRIGLHADNLSPVV